MKRSFVDAAKGWTKSLFAAEGRQIRNFATLARRYGQFRTIRTGSSTDAWGAPIPWYTYPAIEFLSSLELSGLEIFEFGSGNSSAWWAQRAKKLTSVENSRIWFNKVSARIDASRFDYILSEDATTYAEELAKFGRRFDVIVIDGIKRIDCGVRAFEHIARYGGSIVILDNSDWYPALCSWLTTKLGWPRADFHGFGPINGYTWTTTVWINQASVPLLYKSLLQRSMASHGGQSDEDIDFQRLHGGARLP